jgi:uncharacterized protein YyaL (SSP411 family)
VGGLDAFQKYLDRDTVEYSLIHAGSGDYSEEVIARKTLDSALNLIDPVWGGAYQYSTMGDWVYPHHEKLAYLQGEYLRIYSTAYEVFGEPSYLMAAVDIYKYVKTFLTNPQGAFYTSQDADLILGEFGKVENYFELNDKDRKSLGMPPVDKNIYSNHNGLVINGLVSLYESTGDKKYLNDAIRASEWIVKNRKMGGGFKSNLDWILDDTDSTDVIMQKISWLFTHKTWHERGYSHGLNDKAGPFLSDSVNMGLAFINLYRVTKDQKWLSRSEQVARFIDGNFYGPSAGYITSSPSCEICVVTSPARDLDENIRVVRFASKLYSFTRISEYKTITEHAMKYLATPEVATRTLTEPGILIAEMEYIKNIKSS